MIGFYPFMCPTRALTLSLYLALLFVCSTEYCWFCFAHFISHSFLLWYWLFWFFERKSNFSSEVFLVPFLNISIIKRSHDSSFYDLFYSLRISNSVMYVFLRTYCSIKSCANNSTLVSANILTYFWILYSKKEFLFAIQLSMRCNRCVHFDYVNVKSIEAYKFRQKKWSELECEVECKMKREKTEKWDGMEDVCSWE